jgi:hypothetical protein
MKKLVATLVATGMLLGMGSVLAQPLAEAYHGVTITIPQVAFLRFTSGTSNNSVTPSENVLFNLTGFQASEVADTHTPTNTGFNWDDVKVFINQSTDWSVGVSFVQTDGEAFEWNKVSVVTTGLGLASDFDLMTTNAIASGASRGWHSLGFGPNGYRLTLTGEEWADIYTAIVTYTLTAP